MSGRNASATAPSPRPSRYAVIFSCVAVGLFVLMTVLTSRNLFADVNTATLAAPPSFDRGLVQVAAALMIAAGPPTMVALQLALAVWTSRRRLRNLSVATVLAALVGTAAAWATKLLIRDPRPPEHLPLITSFGPSYPSQTMSAVTATAILLGATVVVTRQSRATQQLVVAAGVLCTAALGLAGWLTRSNWLTDQLAGVVLGACVAGLALMVARVRVLPRNGIGPLARTRGQESSNGEDGQRRCAIIYNPSKIGDEATFRRHIEYELSREQYVRTLWLPTAQDEPGRGLAKTAVSKDVSLVIVAGGDGTVRSVCDGMAGSDVPLAIVPAGTGNLLARNLGIPLDERAAIDIAFAGRHRGIDLIKLRVDDQPDTQHLAVMGGMGFDAAIFEQTNADLKRAVGSAAYFVAGAQVTGFEPFDAVIQIDDEPEIRQQLSIAVIGNVAHLQGGIDLFPGATPDDGHLDVMLASPRTLRDWARIVTKIVTTGGQDAQVTRLRGQRVTITAEETVAYQIDGDTIGHARRLVATVQPSALVVCVP